MEHTGITGTGKAPERSAPWFSTHRSCAGAILLLAMALVYAVMWPVNRARKSGWRSVAVISQAEATALGVPELRHGESHAGTMRAFPGDDWPGLRLLYPYQGQYVFIRGYQVVDRKTGLVLRELPGPEREKIHVIHSWGVHFLPGDTSPVRGPYPPNSNWSGDRNSRAATRGR